MLRRCLKRTAIIAAILALSLKGTAAVAESFNSDLWKANKGDSSAKNVRQSMLSDLEKRLHQGMPRANVEAMLGEADWTEGNRHVYVLGPTVTGLDDTWFVVIYDADGRVSMHFLEQG